MKVQYFGDVNDYRKYALLRLLAAAGFTIGINWHLTPDDDGADGNKRDYLAKPDKWRGYDPELFDLFALAHVAAFGAILGQLVADLTLLTRWSSTCSLTWHQQ